MKKLIKVMALLSLWIGLAAPVVGSPGPISTWVQTSTNMTSGSSGRGFAFSPNYALDHTVFAATPTGVFKSTDGGLTWRSTPVLNQNSSSLAISPNYASDHVLIAGTGSGVQKTSDGGTIWNNMIEICWSRKTGRKDEPLATGKNYMGGRSFFQRFGSGPGADTGIILRSPAALGRTRTTCRRLSSTFQGLLDHPSQTERQPL